MVERIDRLPVLPQFERHFTLLSGCLSKRGARRNLLPDRHIERAETSYETGPTIGVFDDNDPAEPSIRSGKGYTTRARCNYLCRRASRESDPRLPLAACSRFTETGREFACNRKLVASRRTGPARQRAWRARDCGCPWIFRAH